MNLLAQLVPRVSGPPAYPNNIRWVGTEAGVAPDDTWSSAASSQDYGRGTRNGRTFVPAEVRHYTPGVSMWDVTRLLPGRHMHPDSILLRTGRYSRTFLHRSA